MKKSTLAKRLLFQQPVLLSCDRWQKSWAEARAQEFDDFLTEFGIFTSVHAAQRFFHKKSSGNTIEIQNKSFLPRFFCEMWNYNYYQNFLICERGLDRLDFDNLNCAVTEQKWRIKFLLWQFDSNNQPGERVSLFQYLPDFLKYLVKRSCIFAHHFPVWILQSCVKLKSPMGCHSGLE